MWYEHAGWEAVIKEAWEKQASVFKETYVPRKLGWYRKALIDWSKNSFSNNDTKRNVLPTKLWEREGDHDAENKIKDQLTELWKREEIYRYQRSSG